jgi:hypothetical protein
MHFFSKILLLALSIALLAPSAFASEALYNKEYVRGFIALKGDFRSMRSTGIKELNYVTGKSFKKQFADGHLDIGAEYNQLMTWFDIDFMPLTPTRGKAEWYAYGITWMWGYKLLHANSFGNIIPSIGPGFELLNIRKPPSSDDMSRDSKLESCMGPTLNTEIEFRLQGERFAAGIYGGYKVIRQDDEKFFTRDINFDKVFVGLKLSWTMLSGFQKQAKDME